MKEFNSKEDARETLVKYLENDKFYQVKDGELAVDKNGKQIAIDLSPFKDLAEGFVVTRRVLGVVLFGEVFIVPNTPNNYFKLMEILYIRDEMVVPYLNGERPVEENPILKEIL